MPSDNTSIENLPTAVPDADTYVPALKDGDIVKVNLPAVPLTVHQRMEEINDIIASLLTTNDGWERLAVALEAARIFITPDAAPHLMATWARSNNTDDIPLEKIRAALQRGVYDLSSSARWGQIPILMRVEEINSGSAIVGWRATDLSSPEAVGLPSTHGLVLTIVKADGEILQYFYGESAGAIYYRTWRGGSPGNFRLLPNVIGLDRSEVDARVDMLIDDATRLTALADALENLRGYLSKERINQLLAGVVGAAAAGVVGVPENLLTLSRNLQIVKGDNQVWRKLNPFPVENSTLVYATILGEARFDPDAPLEIDAIPAQSQTHVAGVGSDNITFYDNPIHPLNTAMPGFSSYISQTAVNIYRSGHDSFLMDRIDTSIIGFDYAMQRYLRAGERVDLLRFGDRTAVMGLSEQEGLYFNIGDTDGGETVQTTVRGALYTEDDTPLGRYDAAEQSDGIIDFVVPGGCRAPLSLIWVVRPVPRNEDEGSMLDSTDTININDLSASFSTNSAYGNFIYTPNYYAGGAGRLRFEIDMSLSSDHIYIISASYEYTAMPINISIGGYARQSLLTGDDYGGSGDFNQTRNSAIQRYLGGHVIMEMMQGNDGYMKARAVIDGVAQNGGAFIDLRRTAEDLGIDDLTAVGEGNGMFIGNEAASIARIYVIRNSRPLTLKQLLQIYNHRDNVGSIYYERRAADDKYVIPAVLQANNANGNPTTLGGGLSMDLNADGTPKNYLTSPIISISSASDANQRTVPEMENASAVVVVFGGFDGGNVLTGATTKTVYNRQRIVNSHGAVGIRGSAATADHISAYGFSFPNTSTIRLDSIYPGAGAGQSTGIHKVFLIR